MNRIFAIIFYLLTGLCVVSAQPKYKYKGKYISLIPQRSGSCYIETTDEETSRFFVNHIKNNSESSLVNRMISSYKFIVGKDKVDNHKINYCSPVYLNERGNNVYVLPTLVCAIKDGESINTILSLYEDVISVSAQYHNTYILSCKLSTSDEVLSLATSIDSTSSVEWCAPDLLAKVTFAANPLYGQQYYLKNIGQEGGTEGEDINIENAWIYERGDTGIVVAIIDMGVDFTHEDLTVNTIPGYTVGGGDGTPNSDFSYHGTMIAGIIGASDNSVGIKGITSDVKLLSVNIANETTGSEQLTSCTNIAAAIRWAAQYADVLNCSWSFDAEHNAIDSAIHEARTQGREGKGCIIVAASGNQAHNPPYTRYYVDYPACLDDVIAVGAYNRYGIRWLDSQWGNGLTLMAPGEEILSTASEDGYMMANGTSFSAAMVSGVAALVLSKRPSLTATQVQDLLCYTARNMIMPGYDIETGFGSVDAGAALSMISQNISPSISGPTHFCYGQTYTLTGVPSDIADSCTITWNYTPNYAIPSYTDLPLLSDSGYICQIKRASIGTNKGVDINLTATVRWHGIIIGTATKEIIMHADNVAIGGRQRANIYGAYVYGDINNLYIWTPQEIGPSLPEEPVEGNQASTNSVPIGGTVSEYYYINPTCEVTVHSAAFRDMNISYSGATPTTWQVMGQHNDSVRFVLPYQSSAYSFFIHSNAPSGCSDNDKIFGFHVDPTPLTIGTDFFGVQLSGYSLEVGFGVNAPLGEGAVQPNVSQWHLFRTKANGGNVIDEGLVQGNSASLSTIGWQSGVWILTGVWNNHTYSATILIP